MLKSFILPVLLIFTCACSSVQKAGVVYHDSFDFAQVNNFSLYNRNSTFSEIQSLSDMRRNAIEIAIEHSMAKKKFSYEAPDKAELIVTYHIFNGKRGEYSQYNKEVHFCTHCLRASTWRIEGKYSQLKQGSLILDLVDPKQNRSIWRSVYPLNLKVKENSADTNKRIKKAISIMLAEYPQSTFHSKFIQ
jgi:hypothetical protein